VKRLVKAPDGTRIKPTEKAILCQLADYHREESGFAYPSIKELARCSCVTERHCRRVIASLEARGVLLRIETMRKDHGGQSSNVYVFKELDSPEIAMRLTESGLSSFKIPRRLKSERGGHHGPGSTVTEGREGRTQSAGPPGRTTPPIEILNEPSDDSHLKAHIELSPISLSPPTRQPRICSSIHTQFAGAIIAVHDGLMSPTPAAFEQRQNFCNGAIDWQQFHFDHLAVEFFQKKAGGVLVLTVSTPDPAATERGLKKYKSRWDAALRNAFGQTVCLKLRLREARTSLPVAGARSVRPGDQDLVPLSSVFEMWHSKREGGGG
jgi:Helix-turn-helix domain